MTSSFDGATGATGGRDSDGLDASHPFHGVNDDVRGYDPNAGTRTAVAEAPAAPPQYQPRHDPPEASFRTDAVPASQHPGAHNGGSELSALAQLRERMETRDSAPVEMWRKEIPGLGLRLVCDPVIDHADFKRWMRAATPKAKRRNGQSDPTDMDQLYLSAAALAHTNQAIEINTNHETGGRPNWVAMPAPEGGPLTLEHQALWREWNVLGSLNLLKKLFRRDPYIITAGQALLDAAGYGADEDDDPEA